MDAQHDPHPFDSAGDGYVVQIIPEPATGAMLALGLAGLAARRRAQRR